MEIPPLGQSILACLPSDLFLDFPCSVLLQGADICRLHILRLPCQLVSIWVQPMGGPGKRLTNQRKGASRVSLPYSLPQVTTPATAASIHGSSSGQSSVSMVPASVGWIWFLGPGPLFVPPARLPSVPSKSALALDPLF